MFLCKELLDKRAYVFLFFVFFLMWTISKLFIFGQEACGISAPRPTPPARQGEEGLIAGEVPKEPIFLEVPK